MIVPHFRLRRAQLSEAVASGEDLSRHMASDVGQAEVASGVIVREPFVVETHQGKVRVWSRLGRGTALTLILPVTR